MMTTETQFISTLFSQIQGTYKSLPAYLGFGISCIIQIQSFTPQIIQSKTNVSLNNLQTTFFIDLLVISPINNFEKIKHKLT